MSGHIDGAKSNLSSRKNALYSQFPQGIFNLGGKFYYALMITHNLYLSNCPVHVGYKVL